MRTHVRSLIYQLKSGLANYRARCARQPCVRDNTGIEADSRDDEQEKEHHVKSNDSFFETPTLQATWIRKKKKRQYDDASDVSLQYFHRFFMKG